MSTHFDLNDRMPQFCLSLTENKKIMFTDNTDSFGLKIKLNDFHRYASSLSLNISFEIELELFQKNQTLTMLKTSVNCDFQQTKKFELKASDERAIENLHSGMYEMKVQPMVYSNICKNLCPYEDSNNGRLDEDLSIIKCRPCKNFTYLIWIESDSFGSKCMQSKSTYEIDSFRRLKEKLNIERKTNIEGIFEFDTKRKVYDADKFMRLQASIKINRILMNQSSLCFIEKTSENIYFFQIIGSVAVNLIVVVSVASYIFSKLKSKYFVFFCVHNYMIQKNFFKDQIEKRNYLYM
jgi:hypothetical protein